MLVIIDTKKGMTTSSGFVAVSHKGTLQEALKFAGPIAADVSDPELSAFVRSFSSLLAPTKSLVDKLL